MIDFGGGLGGSTQRRVHLAQFDHSYVRHDEDVRSDCRTGRSDGLSWEGFFLYLLFPNWDGRTEQDFFDWEKTAHRISQHTVSPLASCLPADLQLIKTRPRSRDDAGLPNLSKQPSKKKRLQPCWSRAKKSRIYASFYGCCFYYISRPSESRYGLN